MKKISKWLCVVAICIVTAASSVSKVNAQPGVSVSFSAFYSNLAPYGQWISEPAYGYVWVPNVAVGFRPYYTNGYWVNTEFGMTWVSSYPWGWAPFHYGRWIYDGFYGWVWVPGDVWGPAWVDWRYGGGVYGWAPLMPGISIGVALGSYSCPHDWWVFVPQRYVLSPVVYRYYEGPRYSVNYVRSTTIINNTYRSGGVTYISGPRTTELHRATGENVRVHSIRDISSPRSTSVSKDAVEIYRPRVSVSAGGKSVAPDKVVKAERPLGKPQPISVNDGKPERLSKQDGGAAGEKGIQEQPKRRQLTQPAERNMKQENSQPRMDRKQPREQPKMERDQAKPQQKQMESRQEGPVNRERSIQEKPQKMERQPQMNREQPVREKPKQMERSQPQQIQRSPAERPPQKLEGAPRMSQPQMDRRMQPQGGGQREMKEPGHGPKK